jgi:hypothetical protein
MKPSPLELRWIRYSEASYKSPEEIEPSGAPARVRLVDATVRFVEDGSHLAIMRIANEESAGPGDYTFDVEVVAVFGLNAALARTVYKAANTAGLVPVVAVNMSRILFASAREFLTMITARAPGPALVLDSVLLEPKDIAIASDLPPPEMLAKVFGAPEAEVVEFHERWATALGDEPPAPEPTGTAVEAPRGN